MATHASSVDVFERIRRDLDRLGGSATEATIKKDLKRFVDSLAPEEALRFLDAVNNWLDDDELTPEEEEDIREGLEEIARGDTVPLREYRARRGI